MSRNRIGVWDSEPVTSHSQPISTDRPTLLRICLKKKKLLCIINVIIIVILVITIPTVIIKTKKIKLSTVTTEITTQQLTITTDNPRTEVQSKPKCDKWKQRGITVAGGNKFGSQLNQLNAPHGIYIDDSKAILVADLINHRIVEWKYSAKEGQIIAGGNGEGNSLDQLSFPNDVTVDKEKNAMIICDAGNERVMRWYRQSQTNPQLLVSGIYCGGVAIDKDGSIYVSDNIKSEVRRWEEGDSDGTLVAGGNGGGYRRNQLKRPDKIFVDKEYSVYVADVDNHRIMKWKKDAKEGIIVAGGNDPGNGLNELTRPYGLIVDNLGRIFIADTLNNRIMQWYEGDTKGSIVIGENGGGHESNQLNIPRSVAFDVEGNLYVTDSQNQRIQKYELCTE
ncbi:unnamed protein product [Adineta steineri]|uniref:Uncharacterized protein n=1 Tax=Adineta steineri TaxID=433720 RepID=A0A819IH70_9BILA|nr:unnamed protein product [Adineta steineri]CAF3918181.1 unnamed protein product [Adineta steineri]